MKLLALLERGCHNTPSIWYYLFGSFHGHFSNRKCMENSSHLWRWWI